MILQYKYLKVSFALTNLCLFLFFSLFPAVVFRNLFDHTQTSNFITFSYFIILVSLLSSFNIIFSEKVSIRVNSIDLLFLGLILYITINRYFIQSVYGFSLKYYEFIGLAILYTGLRICKRSLYPYLFLAIIISAIIQAGYGVLQISGLYPSFHPRYKMTGSFYNPGPYAGFLCSIFSLSAGILLFNKRSLIRISRLSIGSDSRRKFVQALIIKLSLFAVILSLVILPVALSRSSWLAIVTSCLFLCWKGKIHTSITLFKYKRWKILKWLFVPIGVIALTFCTYYLNTHSANGRILIWKITTRIIQDSPWFGVGFDRFGARYMNYQADYFNTNFSSEQAVLADNVEDTFNEPLQVIAELGGVGGLIVAALLTKIGLVVYKSGNLINILAGAGLISILTFSLFSYPSKILPIMVLSVFFIVVISSQTEVKNSVILLSAPVRQFSQLCTTILIFWFAIQGALYLKSIYRAYWVWDGARQLMVLKDFKSANDNFASCEPILKTNGRFLLHYGKSLYLNDEIVKGNDMVLKSTRYYLSDDSYSVLGNCQKILKNYALSESYYRQAAAMVPGKFYPEYLLAKLYFETGQIEKANRIARKILKKKVKVSSIAVLEIKDEMKKALNKTN